MDENSVLQRSENATFQVVAGEAIVICMDTGTYYSMNEVGTDFWELLDGQKSIWQHAETITAKYNQKTADFIVGLRQLAEHGGDAKQLADDFGVSMELVNENLPQFRGNEAESHADSLVSRFSVNPEEVMADLLEMAADLLKEQLIETS